MPNPNLARAWLRWVPGNNEANNLPESLAFLRDILKSRSFDGILGFSQGAVMAVILTALLERPHIYPPFLINGKTLIHPCDSATHRKFCISVAGCRVNDPIAISKNVFASNYSTPTLHIIGKLDTIIEGWKSRNLAKVCTNARIEEHNGGHFIPFDLNWPQLMAAYMQDFTNTNAMELDTPTYLTKL
ncbi:serine hydrolase FSH [Mycena rebaudengoi]|nr:serine hydrolase FSH [Mycena rebaudengoi]